MLYEVRSRDAASFDGLGFALEAAARVPLTSDGNSSPTKPYACLMLSSEAGPGALLFQI